MSRISPSPDLLTILLPIKPAISPRTSHDNIPMVILPLLRSVSDNASRHATVRDATNSDGHPNIRVQSHIRLRADQLLPLLHAHCENNDAHMVLDATLGRTRRELPRMTWCQMRPPE